MEASFTRGPLMRSAQFTPSRGVSVYCNHTVLGMHLATPSETMTTDRADENSTFGLYISDLVLLSSMIV
jgi:hypothetical protein